MRRFVPPVPQQTAVVRLVSGIFVAATLAWTTLSAQIPGRNVNMVSGTSPIQGDPYLQRQNEPSIAASTRNPLHLMAGSNDYRTVDVPGLPNGEETGDAWLGLFKSFDGGQRWVSDLLPGYPQDQSPAGVSSPLKQYQAGADAVVRAGTNGLLYYSGLVFDRGDNGKSGVFLARFIDNNNQEAGDSIAYLGTTMVAQATGARFLDKPWMAVDVPRANATTCVVTDNNIIPTRQDGHRRRHGFDRWEPRRGDDRGRGNHYRNTRNDRGRKPAPPPAGQRIQAGAVYVAYSSITGDAATLRSEIYVVRSMDCGATWSAPMRVSRAEDQVNQGATLTIDPKSGAVYIAWRRFDPDLSDNNDLDAMMMARLPFGATRVDTPGHVHKFAKPVRRVGRQLHRLFEHREERFLKSAKIEEVSENLDQFDLGTTGVNFRTNAYPTMTADGTGRVYIAWTQRGFAADTSGKDGARLVIATTRDGRTFTAPKPVDDHLDPGRGHQLMPSITFAGGKLMLVFYDLRDSKAQTHNRVASDANTATGLRQTIDIRAAMASPGDAPAFAPSVKVSDYLMGLNPNSGELEELQVNPPNLPMFKQGTVPFIGDYIDVTAAPAFVRGKNGAWEYNSAATGQPPMFHAAWTDNRDVRPPRDGNWANYTPARLSPNEVRGQSQFDPAQEIPQCVDGAGNPGSRNQNIYGARITGGLLAGSPGNSKPLSPDLQRGFVVFAQNTSPEPKSFRMTILNQPPGGRASFEQFPLPPYTRRSPAPKTAIEMIVPARSTATRTVYATSSDPHAQIDVEVSELVDLRALPPGSYPKAPEKSSGLEARVVLNPDIENPDIENPDIENPDIENPDIENAEVYNPDIENPDIENPDIENPDIENVRVANPDIENPDIENPDIENPDIENVRVANPDIENPNIGNPDIENPDIENPDIENPDIENPDIENGSIADVTWKVTNTGNTTASFNVNLFLGQQNLPAGVKTQLILLKTYRTPATVPNGCQLGFQTRNILLASIRNPQFVPPGGGTADPNDPAETNATLWLSPGEEGRIVLRVIDDDTSNNLIISKPDGSTVSIDPAMVPREDVTPVVQQQAVNSEDADSGVTEPPVTPPPPPATAADEAWTTPNMPVRLNVLRNDADVMGSTKIVTTHPAALPQNMGFGMGELVYMPATGLLYEGGARSVGVIDPVTNTLVGRMPIDSSDPGASYGFAAPQTGLIFFRMGGNGQQGSTIYAYGAQPGTPSFNQSLMITPARMAAIDALGSTFTMSLDPSGRTLYYAAGSTSPAQQTISAINADPSSPGLGAILWTVTMPVNTRVMHVVHNPANGRLYIAALNVGAGPPQGGVFVMNPAAPAAPAKIAGTDQAVSLAVNPLLNLVFAAGANGNFRLNTIDGSSDTLLAQVPVASGGNRINNAEDRLVVHYSTGKVYLRGPNQVFVFDGLRGSPTFNTLKATIGVGPDFNQSDLDVDQATGIVASVGNFSHQVTLIDALSPIDATSAVVLPRAVADVTIDPIAHRVFAGDFLNSIHNINAASMAASLTTSLTLAPEAGQVLVNPVTNRAYATTAGVDSSISVLSSGGLLGQVGSLPTTHGRWGFGARYDATNTYFFTNSASDPGGNTSRPGTLTMVNGATDAVVATVPTIGQPFGAGINQSTAQVYVAGLNGVSQTGATEAGKIRIHDALNPSTFADADLSLIPVTAGQQLSFGRQVVINPDTNDAYAAVLGGSSTSVLWLPTSTLPAAPVAQPITLPASFGAVSFTAADRVEVIRVGVFGPGNTRIYLGLFNASTNAYKVAVLDGTSHAVVGAYAGGGHSRLHTASWLLVNAATNRLYVVDYNADTVTMLNASTLAVLATTALPDGPSATAFNTASNRLYVASIDSKTISAINGTTLAITSTVKLPLHAFFLHVNESESRIYTSGGNSNDEAGFMMVSDVGGVLGSPVTVTSASTPAGGTAVVNADSSVTYTPSPGFTGDDTFTYSVTSAGGVSTGTVTIHVLAPAASPVAIDDDFAMAVGAPSLIIPAADLLRNDAYAGAPTVVIATSPQHGSLVPSAASPGGYDYVPGPGYAGFDSFSYSLSGVSNAATVSIYVPATGSLIVTNTNDSGAGSLRAAIDGANLFPGPQTITFNIPGASPASPAVITVSSALPAINGPTVIDATTQPSYDGRPVVQVRSPSSTAGMVGFFLNADNITIRGLSITNFANGILAFQTFSGHVIEQNTIGTDRNNTSGLGNGNGVQWRASSSTIRENVISGNSGDGLYLVLGANANVIHDNNIGLGWDGTSRLSNTGHGVVLFDGVSNTVIENNLISGNVGWGINIENNGDSAPVTATRIRGNTIGLTTSGDLLPHSEVNLVDSLEVNWGPRFRGNTGGGINVVTAPGTVIGEAGKPNTISGNVGSGIRLSGTFTTAPVIQYNKIGTDPSGASGRGNTDEGIRIEGASNLLIGGANGNLISGNLSDGITVNSGTGNRVEGNVIGLSADLLTAIGNGRYQALDDPGCCHAGITVQELAPETVIGGEAIAQRNIIAGNHTGVWIGITYSVVIENNMVGISPAGGGTLIPNDGDAGIALYGSSNTTVKSNMIAGNTGFAGLFLYGASGSTVESNDIHANTGAGIIVADDGDENTIHSNSIDGNGGLGIDLGWDNVTANDSPDEDEYQNYPVLSNATNIPGPTTRVTYDTTSFFGGGYQLHFYASPSCDASGHGEGKQLVGTFDVDGGEVVSVALDALVPVYHAITATATNADGDTSEFSACAIVTPPTPVIAAVAPGPFTSGQMITITGNDFNVSGLTDVILQQGGNDYPVQYIWQSTPTRIIARTQGVGNGPAAVVVKTSGNPQSAPFNVTIQAQAGTPILHHVFNGDCFAYGYGGNPQSPVDTTTAAAGSNIIIVGTGIDTSGTTFVFTPIVGGAPVTVSGSTACAGPTGEIAVTAQVPAVGAGNYVLTIRASGFAIPSANSNSKPLTITP